MSDTLFNYRAVVPLFENNIFRQSGLEEVKNFVRKNHQISFFDHDRNSSYKCNLKLTRKKLFFNCPSNSAELGNNFYSWICAFSMAANIAIPGIINTHERTTVFIDENPYFEYPPISNEIWECLWDQNEDTSQKFLSLLKIEDVWTWAVKQQGFCDGKLSDTNVSRVVVAYTNLFTDNHEFYFPRYFIWSILGLEALYAKGSGNVLDQIREKLEVALNLDSKEKKLVNTLYQMRSRFFHGDFHLSNMQFAEVYSKEAILAEHETIDIMLFGVRLFMASLQFCAKNNLSELKFCYALSDDIQNKS